MKPILVATHLDPESRKAFRIAAAQAGKSASQLLRELVMSFLVTLKEGGAK